MSSERAAVGETTKVVLLQNNSPIAYANPTSYSENEDRSVRPRKVIGQEGHDNESAFNGVSMSATFPEIGKALHNAIAIYDDQVYTHSPRDLALSVTRRFPETGETETKLYIDLAIVDTARSVAPAADNTITINFNTGKPPARS